MYIWFWNHKLAFFTSPVSVQSSYGIKLEVLILKQILKRMFPQYLSVHSSFAWIEAYFFQQPNNEYCTINQYLLTTEGKMGEGNTLDVIIENTGYSVCSWLCFFSLRLFSEAQPWFNFFVVDVVVVSHFDNVSPLYCSNLSSPVQSSPVQSSPILSNLVHLCNTIHPA